LPCLVNSFKKTKYNLDFVGSKFSAYAGRRVRGSIVILQMSSNAAVRKQTLANVTWDEDIPVNRGTDGSFQTASTGPFGVKTPTGKARKGGLCRWKRKEDLKGQVSVYSHC
jgi:hypothetical protein